jgi:hypothetical protein
MPMPSTHGSTVPPKSIPPRFPFHHIPRPRPPCPSPRAPRAHPLPCHMRPSRAPANSVHRVPAAGATRPTPTCARASRT